MIGTARSSIISPRSCLSLAKFACRFKPLLDKLTCLIGQSPAQFRIGQQSLKRFGQPLNVAGVRQKPCFFVRHQFLDSFQSRRDHWDADRHGFFEDIGAGCPDRRFAATTQGSAKTIALR